MSIAPGWYDDGATPNAQRWFDGAAWTQHLRPVIAPQPSTGPDDALHWILPVGRSWQSITAGYLGIFGLLIWPLAPIAIWLGVWALVRARHGGHGRGRAIFAIVAGALGTVAGTLAVVFWM